MNPMHEVCPRVFRCKPLSPVFSDQRFELRRVQATDQHDRGEPAVGRAMRVVRL